MPTSKSQRRNHITPLSVPAPSSGKSGGRRSFLMGVIMVAALAFAFEMVWFNNSSRNALNQIQRDLLPRVHGTLAGTMQSNAMALPTPASITAVTPVPMATPAPRLTATGPNPMAWLMAHKDRTPKQTTLLDTQEFTVGTGDISGSVIVPSGTKADVIGFDSDTVSLKFFHGVEELPIPMTDFVKQVKEEMEKVQPESDAGEVESASAAAVAEPPQHVSEVVAGSSFHHPGGQATSPRTLVAPQPLAASSPRLIAPDESRLQTRQRRGTLKQERESHP